MRSLHTYDTFLRPSQDIRDILSGNLCLILGGFLVTNFRLCLRLAPVPILQTGRSTNLVDILFTVRSRTRTRMVTHLSLWWSLLSSTIRENFSVLHRDVILSFIVGANALLMMWVLMDEKLCAIGESGNIFFTRTVKWSATDIGRLCSAMK